jgi:hypothetical protein
METRSAIARAAAAKRWTNTPLDVRYALRRRIAEAKHDNTAHGIGPLLTETPLWARLNDGERRQLIERVYTLLDLPQHEAEERWTAIARAVGRRGDVYAL